MFERSSMKTSFPSRSRAIEGEEGPYPVKYARARAVASRSWPANTVARISGRAWWERASATPGRAQDRINLLGSSHFPEAQAGQFLSHRLDHFFWIHARPPVSGSHRDPATRSIKHQARRVKQITFVLGSGRFPSHK